ncbi:RNA-dependent DNA polymerase [Bacillus spizizenii]|uniref:retron St85 family RNA-directed DNA polymerase n=1 Tax=Bacillus spizizenii TaxID=96241 RepID=UPI000B535609|nr:retron St85 family RNA-directed DNA polymerase [Bacillus spizizenii]OWV35303.1 RNA-dependent DNA polymerase [Bacillus spizizenii]
MNIATYSLGIPKIENIEELSHKINLSEYTLHKILKSIDQHYKIIKIPKKNGEFRELSCPSFILKGIQKWILKNILTPNSIDPSATAFIKTKGIKNNVNRHQGNQFFLCLDIDDFFPSIQQNKVYNLFKSIGYNTHISLVLSNLCTYKGVLPQGGVTSPAISNLVNIKLDRRISGYCSSRNIVYSRYADDFTFSSNNPHKLTKSITTIRSIIQDEGYKLNNKKTRFLKPGNKRKITGLVLSDETEEFGIGRKQKRILRAKIHTLVFKLNESDKSWKALNEHINGWLSYLKGIDFEAYSQLLAYKENLKDKKATLSAQQRELFDLF